MTNTPKVQDGIWTLTAPDGRTWKAESPLRVCGMEQRERVPADVALLRIREALKDESDEEVAAINAETVDRFHHALRKHGWHPGRTDEPIADCLERALAAGPAGPYPNKRGTSARPSRIG